MLSNDKNFVSAFVSGFVSAFVSGFASGRAFLTLPYFLHLLFELLADMFGKNEMLTFGMYHFQDCC